MIIISNNCYYIFCKKNILNLINKRLIFPKKMILQVQYNIGYLGLCAYIVIFSLHNFLKRENNIIVLLKQYVAVDP